MVNEKHSLNVEHAIAMIEHGLTLIREGNQQLRNLGVTVTNPLADIPELGRTVDGRSLTKKIQVVKRWNARKGVRNNARAEQKPRRAQPKLVRR